MHSCTGRCWALALSTMSLCLLAALPASSSAAATAGRAGQIKPNTVSASYTLNSMLTPQQLEELVGELPVGVGTSALSPAELAQALAHLPALESLHVSHLQEGLKKSFEGLGSGAKLEEALSNPATLLSGAATEVEKLLSPTELLALKGLLGGTSLTKTLQEALETADAGEVLHELIASGSEGPGKTLEALLETLPSPVAQGLLGSTLGSEPVSEQSVQTLAEKLDISAQQLAESAGQNTTELPGTAKALTMPLSDGEVVSVLDGVDKAAIGTLDTLAPEGGPGGGEAGGSGSGGSGAGSGGSGAGGAGTGSGSGGGAGSGGNPNAVATGPTVIVEMPSTSSSKAGAASGKGAERVKVIGHRVHGDMATVTVQAPGAGTLTLRNGDIRPISRKVGHAGRLSIQVRLSKAGIAAARRHGHRMQLRLSVSFTPAHGARSSAPVTLLFK